ncbi:MAG TPA: superoxide dismutase family protein, partial [Ramlibacter sp.]|nr:superoxide dismutase family protein [Ramlibacter sp.]
MQVRLIAAAAFAALAALGCATLGGPKATAHLAPTAGSSTSGHVNFVQSGGRVLVSGEVRGLKPNAEHGFHVHENGDCSSADAMSAGGHFNPGGHQHGRPGAAAHHAGDMPNLRADA